MSAPEKRLLLLKTTARREVAIAALVLVALGCAGTASAQASAHVVVPASALTVAGPTGITGSSPSLQRARGEDFGGQPSDVLVRYSASVGPSDASQCVGIDAAGNAERFGGIGQGPTARTIRLYLVPEGTMPTEIQCSVSPPPGAARLTETVGVTAPIPTSGGVVSDPIDSKYLTDVPFGDSSFWIQPWRAYLDTWPASRLLDSLGVNFTVTSTQAEDTATLLQDSGFTLARIEIPWDSLSYSRPTEILDEPDIRTRLLALHSHGLRPLIVLNGYSGDPSPSKAVTLTSTLPALAGATTVRLTAASAAEVVPGKTGFDDLSFGGDPDILITAVSGTNVAKLSRPLPAELPPGPHAGTTLLYAPFGPPRLLNGAPNPAFQATLDGWLSYVATVSHEATSIFGAGGYDLEVWNELAFGSQFLNEADYYSPARESGSGEVPATLLDETVRYVRDAANGISSQVGISDGFASQTPFASGANVPAGTTALSKHLYSNPQTYPSGYTPNGIQPINALGEKDFKASKSGGPPYSPLFVPSFVSAQPEYFLTATQTETAVRDLAPITTSIYGVPHGRSVAPVGGVAPQQWMTEYNIGTEDLVPLSPSAPGEAIGTSIVAAQARRIQAEGLLRSLVSWVNKGMTREYFYAAADVGALSLISEGFMAAVNGDPSVYPGDGLGGETIEAFRRMLQQFEGPGPGGPARQLQLVSIAQKGNHTEFAGDGTAAHPELYDREVLAVLPFQASPTRFVIPFYVMTPNLTTVHYPDAPESSLTRFDLPNENFRITLGNLPESSAAPTVSAYDPIRNEATPARLISRQGDRAVFEFAATDYPRTLSISF